MPGDVSEPGDTPRTENLPWSLPEPEPTWWPPDADPDGSGDESGRSRHPRRRPPQAPAQAPAIQTLDHQASSGTGTLRPPSAPETADAHSAGGRDVARELDPPIKQRAAEELRTDPAGVERDHNRPDPFRYDPLRPPAGYPGPTDLITGQPVEETPPPTPAEDQAPTEPDVMVLPEPDDRNRPTVSLDERDRGRDRERVPEQGRTRATEPLPRPTGDATTDARLEKLESSPFWLNEAERAAAGPQPEVSSHTAERGYRRRARPGRRSTIRRPARALLALLALALVAAFFSWVSAEPFWLAVGHGNPGYAITTACHGSGVTQRCTGRFAAADGSFALPRVTLLGVTGENRTAGSVTPARMVSAGSRTAYLGDGGALVHLRWMLGFLLVLICGYGIAGLTGARRLDDARARRLTVLASLSAPLLLLAGFLFAAY